MLFFFLTLIGTIVLSFIPERLVKPCPVKRPTLKSILLQSALVTLVFLILTLIVQRAVFSGITIIVFLIILVAVNNAKYKALKEPMVFSDFAMFAQAFKHPRLYFPFLGLVPVIMAPIIIIGLIITVITLEPALDFVWQRLIPSLFMIVILHFLIRKIAATMPITKKPEEDTETYGLQNSLCIYTQYAFSQQHKQHIRETLASAPFSAESKHNQYPPPRFLPVFSDKKPNITVIQSESFFDARRLNLPIRTDVLKNFDELCANSVQYGQLNVPAWGANTMRTEFSFLSGIKNQQMDLFRYYPYQFLKNQPVSSIASALKLQGYYCVCIHPHPASFFGRDQLFPALGFDEFIDSQDFDHPEKFGPYISDQTVTNKIIEVTKDKTDKPLFIFAITMENHGPLHLEKALPEDQTTFYSTQQPSQLNDLTIYLRHLKNADKMLKQLSNYFSDEKTDHTLCFYGDHIPSMPDIYHLTAYNNHHSDYLIWTNSKPKKAQHREISVEKLASTLLNLD